MQGVFHLDILIRDVLVLRTDPLLCTERGNICISGNIIVAVGATPERFSPQYIIEGHGKLAMPGLVNCHTHLYMTLFRNYADDLSFQDWLFDRIMPKEDLLTGEDAYWCSQLAMLEMIQTGTTCFLDMHMHRGQCLKAARAAGMRTVLSRGIVGNGPEDLGAQRRLDDLWAELEEAEASGGMLNCMLAPHAIYTCPPPLLRHIAALAKEKKLRVHIHLSETQKEFDDCMAQHGCTPTELLCRLGLFDVPAVAAHGVYLTENDMDLLREHGVFVATNPISNMKLGNGFAPVPKLLEKGVQVCLGTDGAASNNNLNLFKEMAVLSLIHKGLARDPEALPAAEVLRMATQNGADALGLGALTGSIETGKRADIALVDLARAAMLPQNDPATALVYSASGYEVDTVLIDGRPVMEGGEVKTIDSERVFSEVERIRARIL